MPIQRRIPTDDDGTGTTGTRIDRNWLIQLYDDIDAALSSAIGSGIKQISTTYTLLNTDKVIECTTGTFTITLHPATDSTRGSQRVDIKNSGTGEITVNGNGYTIDGETSILLISGASVTLVSNGAAWIIV